jgi:4-hydroxy-tetrahydrodipicolinate synthase
VGIVGRHVSRLSGYAPALPTPFGENGSVDLSCLERFCIQQIHAGATALVVCGATGEAPTLTFDERREIVRVAVKASRGRVPVIAGAGSNSTARVVELAVDAERAGADAILSVVPYYNKPVQHGLFAHFKAVADSIGIPVILHDVPSRTVVGLADVTVARLAENPRFIGLMDSTGNSTRIGGLRTLLGEDFRLLSGDDPSAFAMIANGGNGCISVTSNIAPGLCRAMYLALRHGRVGLARRIAAEVTKLNTILCQDGDPAPVKHALGLLGLMSPAVRLPLVEPGDQDKADIALALQHFCEHNPDDGVGTLAMAPVPAPGLSGAREQRSKPGPSTLTPG